MKAIVLETKDGWAAVLREDGVVVKVRRDCQVGQTIQLNTQVISLPMRRRRWIQSAVAAALALVVLTGSYTYTTVSACAYVSLDVGQTSVEVAVNRLGRVIAVNALNEDSQELAKTLTGKMRNQKVEPALDKAMAHLHDNGYLTDDEDGYIIAGVTSDSERRGKQLSLAVEHSVAAAGEEDIRLLTLDVTKQERGDAGKQSMSGGRYVLRQRGMEPPQTADFGSPSESNVAASIPDRSVDADTPLQQTDFSPTQQRSEKTAQQNDDCPDAPAQLADAQASIAPQKPPKQHEAPEPQQQQPPITSLQELEQPDSAPEQATPPAAQDREIQDGEQPVSHQEQELTVLPRELQPTPQAQGMPPAPQNGEAPVTSPGEMPQSGQPAQRRPRSEG